MTGYCHPAIRLCEFSDSYYRSAQPLFLGITGAITPELVAAVTDALEQLRTELEQQLFPMHFGLSVGRHRCVRQLHQEAIARLPCRRRQARTATANTTTSAQPAAGE